MTPLIVGSLTGLLVTVVLVWLLPRRWGHWRAIAAAGLGFGTALALMKLLEG